MPYKCLIVDDEELARDLIANHLSHFSGFEIIASCANALEARTILHKEHIDLLFLDIEMPLLKGTDFLKSIPYKPSVIFTTAFRNYAVEGFELRAIDYLVKPILFDRFMMAIERFEEFMEPKSANETKVKDHIFIQSHKKNIKILLAEILYVESLKDYIKIVFQNDELMIKMGISKFEQLLDDRFLRSHRSFLVNKDQVTAFTKNDIEIQSIEIPIGEYYKAQVLKSLG